MSEYGLTPEERRLYGPGGPTPEGREAIDAAELRAVVANAWAFAVGIGLGAEVQRHRDCVVCLRLAREGIGDFSAAVAHLKEAAMNPSRRPVAVHPRVLDGIGYDDDRQRDSWRAVRKIILDRGGDC
jgi:hypothetical protein